MQQAPASTVQRMHNEAVPALYEQINEHIWEEAYDGKYEYRQIQLFLLQVTEYG
jgi:hypothetical protein